MSLYHRMRSAVVHGILGVRDTPRRIAWGVFLGSVVAMTPTLGFQIVLYVAIATVLRANKLSGIPILFISNPITAVPLYWFCWKVSAVVLGSDQSGPSALEQQLSDAEAQADDSNLWTDIWTADFWEALGETLLDMGAEMWTGSLLLGVALGIPMYFLTLWGVKAFRRAQGKPA